MARSSLTDDCCCGREAQTSAQSGSRSRRTCSGRPWWRAGRCARCGGRAVSWECCRWPLPLDWRAAAATGALARARGLCGTFGLRGDVGRLAGGWSRRICCCCCCCWWLGKRRSWSMFARKYGRIISN